MLAQSLPKRRIVLVGDDKSTERNVARTLTRSFPDVDVFGTRNAEEALRALDDERSRLLIADVQTRVFNDIALAAVERKRVLVQPMIAMSTRPFDVWHERAAALGAAAWLEKPLRAHRLVGLVERILVAPTGFSGEIAVDGLPELVQLLCMANTSGALRIDHGAECGTIWFDRGSIVHAEAGAECGVKTFHRMLKWTGGVFALERRAQSTRRTIEIPAMQLLLEGVRLMDEDGAASHARRGDSEVRLRAVRPEESGEPPEAPATDRSSDWLTPQQRASESFERGLGAVREKRYEEALQDWERAVELDPENRIYNANLRRLRELARKRSEP